jgi:hypothetical protein
LYICHPASKNREGHAQGVHGCGQGIRLTDEMDDWIDICCYSI